MVDRENVIAALEHCATVKTCDKCPMGDECTGTTNAAMAAAIELLKEQEPDVSKYQYKIEHTDCIWYSDSESRCLVTCSQYRDGWNDAMDFIYKNGAGYSPYKRR